MVFNMAKYQFKGLDEYAQYLQKIGKNTPEILGAGVYTMADIVTNEVRKALDALPAVEEKFAVAAYKNGTQTSLTKSQKKGLQNSLGISGMQNDNGFLNVKIGFDGYNNVRTRTYPKGQPNALIARATESGSSVRKKTPFIRPAVNASKKQAIDSCKVVIDEKIYAIEKK